MEAKLTVRLADRFSNTNILAGHALSLYTEGGGIPIQGQVDASGVTSVTPLVSAGGGVNNLQIVGVWHGRRIMAPVMRR